MPDSADHLLTMRLLVLASLVLAAGCDRTPSQPIAEPTSVRAPGAVPTHELSFDLIGRAPEERLAILQQFVTEGGNACATAVRATLEGGVDGTDEWTLVCTDGAWTIWFRPASNPTVELRGDGAL